MHSSSLSSEHWKAPHPTGWGARAATQLLSRCVSVTVLKLLAQQLPAAHGFPGGSVVNNPPANAGDAGLIARLGGSPGEGKGNPLQYSHLGNPQTEEPGGLQSMERQESDTT